MQRFNLKGKVALVTGGNGGIGAGIARGLLECGAAVVIAGRNVGKNKAMVTTLQTLGPPVSAVAMDVTEASQCHAGVRETVQRHGQLNILVNNAGMGNGKLPQDLTVAEWHEIMNTNLTSAFILSQAAYPEMKKAGGGKIINIGSMASYLSFGAVPAYGASKAGIIQFGRACASAWAKDNIQVNTILPGYIDTDMTRARLQRNAELHARALARTAAGRMGTPDDFAGIAAFLASPASDFITGADIPVDGGFLWGI
jgi:2-dehydro-3-deoxy-D-gluconate 5-dehydrogenase